jgi:hypothetical protein
MEFTSMDDLSLAKKDELLDIELDSNLTSVDCLSEISDKLQEIKDNGEEVSQLAIESLNISITHILKSIGAKPKKVISVESFSNPMHKARSLEVAIEGLGDWIDAIYDKIYVLMGTVKELILGTNRTLKAKANGYINKINNILDYINSKSGTIQFSDTAANRYPNLLPVHEEFDRTVTDNFTLGEILKNINEKSKHAIERMHNLPGALVKEGYNIHEIIRSTSMSNLISDSKAHKKSISDTRFGAAVIHYNQSKAQIGFNVFNTSFAYNPEINYTLYRRIISFFSKVRGFGAGAFIGLVSAGLPGAIVGAGLGFLAAKATSGMDANIIGLGVNLTAYTVTELNKDRVSDSSYIERDHTTYAELHVALINMKTLASTVVNSIDNHNRVLDTLEDINKTIRHELTTDIPDTQLKNLYRRVCIVSNIHLARQYVSTIKKASKTMMFSIDRACDEMIALAKKCK